MRILDFRILASGGRRDPAHTASASCDSNLPLFHTYSARNLPWQLAIIRTYSARNLPWQLRACRHEITCTRQTQYIMCYTARRSHFLIRTGGLEKEIVDILQLSCQPRKPLYWRGLIRHCSCCVQRLEASKKFKYSCPIIFRTAEACCDELHEH